MLVNFELTGQTALLMHADDVEAGDDLKVWRDDAKKRKESVAGDDRSPPWTWQTYLYSDGKYLAIPADNVMAAIRFAAAKIPLPGGKGSESFKRLSQSGILVNTEYCTFRNAGEQILMSDIARLKNQTFAQQKKAVQDLGFDLFVKRAAIKGSNKKHVRVRAKFNQWSLTGTILVSEPKITFGVLEEMLQGAGRYAGLCDWRPSAKESPGPHGQFAASLKRVDR